ncbi:uncharacterized protein [Pseudorasbora parva]|uniref:uncharacterized protein isoform X2 n=1 Tax=Pseudorasbora parva TaxID=51549 RepID=UPI00351F7B18
MFAYIYIIVLLSEMPASVLGVTLEQGQQMLVKAVGKTSYLPCKVTNLKSWDYIHWYQKREGEAPSRLLSIYAGGSFIHDTNNPQANDFTVDRTQLYNLKLSNTKPIHAAVYYCAYWDTSNDKKVFGSGTRLYVTETNADKVTPPTLTGYLPSIKTSGKQTMLCHASDMFPDFLLFTWQKKTKSEDWKEVPKEQILEQTQKKENGKPFTVTSMLVLDEPPAQDDEYKCIAIHEGGTEKAKSVEMKKANQDSEKKDTTSKKEAITEKPCPTPTPEETSDTSPEQMRRLYVFVYAYGVMLMKNGLYFCVVSILLLKRKYGKKEESS